MFSVKISWFNLVLLTTIIISIMNFKLFSIAYANFSQDNLLLSIFLFLSYFSLLYFVLATFVSYSTNDTNFYTKQIAKDTQRLVYFSEVSSCGTSTAVSLPCMFSSSKRQDYKSFEFKENALDILQKIGVKIFWLSNNAGACKGVCDRIENKQVKMINAEYDEALFVDFDEALKQLDSQNIVILHVQGSHGPAYYKRYPQSFKKFQPSCETNQLEKCSSKELVNTYDKTILYTDYILSELVKKLEKYKDYKPSVLYVSDHGESLGENGLYLHSMPYAIAPSTQTHVPLIFYSLDKNLSDKAVKNKDLKLSHDNIFSTLLGYFSVKSSFYDETYDLLSTKLKENL